MNNKIIAPVYYYILRNIVLIDVRNSSAFLLAEQHIIIYSRDSRDSKIRFKENGLINFRRVLVRE